MQFSIFLFGSQYKSNILYGRIGSNFFFKTDFKFYISMFLIPDSFCWNIENVESALSLLVCSSLEPISIQSPKRWAVPKRCPMGASVTLTRFWRVFFVSVTSVFSDDYHVSLTFLMTPTQLWKGFKQFLSHLSLPHQQNFTSSKQK